MWETETIIITAYNFHTGRFVKRNVDIVAPQINRSVVWRSSNAYANSFLWLRWICIEQWTRSRRRDSSRETLTLAITTSNNRRRPQLFTPLPLYSDSTLVANFPQSVPVLWKSVSSWRIYGQKFGDMFFDIQHLRFLVNSLHCHQRRILCQWSSENVDVQIAYHPVQNITRNTVDCDQSNIPRSLFFPHTYWILSNWK